MKKSQLKALIKEIANILHKECDETDLPQKQYKSTYGPMAAVNLDEFKKKLKILIKKELNEAEKGVDLNENVQTKFVNRGEIKLKGGINEKDAKQIADTYWDIFHRAMDNNGVWNFKTRGDRYCCAVGLYNNKPAILNVTTTSGRLELITADSVDELVQHNLKEMSTTSGVAGYNTPFAFSKRGGSKKALDVTKKMGYSVAKSISNENNKEE